MSEFEGMFEDDVDLIKNAAALEEEYTPERLVCRDDILNEYRKVFKPIYKGRPPKSAFLYGDTGAGKTASTKFMRERLEEEVARKNEQLPPDEQINFDVIWINCENITKTDDRTSSYRIAIEIVNYFREPSEQISRTGHAPKAVYEMMYQHFDEVGGTFMIVLDEINKIGDDRTILYDLPRARDIGHVDDARIGVIGISNEFDFHHRLHPKIKDTLMEFDINFPSYNATELQEIVIQRADVALYDGVIDEEHLRLCGSKAYDEAQGSARRAIRTLKIAAEEAEDEGSEKIREAHIDKAIKETEHGSVVQHIADLDDHKLYILKSIAHLTENGTEMSRTSTIHTVYEAITNAVGDKTLTQRAMYNHLSKLVMMGFLKSEEHNEGEHGGRWAEHGFKDNVTPQKVRDAFEQEDKLWLDVRKLPIDS